MNYRSNRNPFDTHNYNNYAFKKSELLEILQKIDSSFSFDSPTYDNQEGEPPLNASINSKPQYDYEFYLFRKPLLTFHEAACILTGYDPQYVNLYLNDLNFNQNFSDYLGAFRYLNSCAEAMLFPYNKDDNELYADELKDFLLNENIIIDGFNDNRLIENSINSGQQTALNTDNLNAEIKQLKEIVASKDAEIEQLKAIQTTKDEPKLSTREENNIIKVLAVLTDMATNIDISKPYEAHGIMKRKAELLGISPFPSDESIKKWFSKANDYKNPN